MNGGAAVKRRRENAQHVASAVAKRRLRDPQVIGDLVACPAFLHAFQATVKQLQAVFPSRHRRSFEANAFQAMRSYVCSGTTLLLITGGRLCALLAQRLLCFDGDCAVRDPLRLGTSTLSLAATSSATRQRLVWRLQMGTAALLPLWRFTLRRRFWQPAAKTAP